MATQQTGITYLVVEDFGSALGRSYRETDVTDCDREALIEDMIGGQFVMPVRIVAFDPDKCDVSASIVQEVVDRAWAQGIDLPKDVKAFCESHGAQVPEIIRTAW